MNGPPNSEAEQVILEVNRMRNSQLLARLPWAAVKVTGGVAAQVALGHARMLVCV